MPDHIRFVALDAILGGNFTSRLNMNLREDKHWSYGARTRLTDAIGQGSFRAGAGVQTDKTAESMVEIQKELREILSTRKPDAKELKFAQDTIAIALPGKNETSDDIADSYGEILTYGLKDSYWNDFVGEVTALTPADINKSASKPDSSGGSDLGRGRRSVEDRGQGAGVESRRGHRDRHGRKAGRAVVSRRSSRHFHELRILLQCRVRGEEPQRLVHGLSDQQPVEEIDARLRLQ